MKRIPLIVALSIILALTQTSTAVSQWVKTTHPGVNLIYPIMVSSNHHLYAHSFATYVSSDYGDTWKQFGEVTGHMIFDQGAVGFTTQFYDMYRTLDTGNTWQLIRERSSDPPEIIPWAFAPNGNVYGFGTTKSGYFLLYISKDTGITWDSLPGLKFMFDILEYKAIAIAFNKNGVMFVGGKNGLYHSTDEGKSWKKNIVIDKDETILSIAINSKNQIFVSTSNSAMRSTDDGNTWTRSWEPPMPCGGVSLIVVDPSDRVFIGTDCDGILYSPDNGERWIKINDTLLYNWEIADIAIDPAGYLYASQDAGLYRRLLSGLSAPSSVGQSVASPMSTYPNPFSASTTITFSTDKSAINQVTIYNLLGCEVAQLFSGSLDAGDHSFPWDAHEMPAGMYICMIRSGGKVMKIPQMLVKE